MRFQYLSLDTKNMEMKNFETVKVFDVPTSNTEPFLSALYVLSYLAYPESASKQKDFFQAMKFQWQIRHADPKLAKAFLEKKYFNTLLRGGTQIVRRVSAGRIALLQIFKISGKVKPTLDVQIPRERILLGWSKEATESNSTYKTKVWGPTRPVLHVATALAYIQAMNNVNDLKKNIAYLVTDPLALIGLLELSENLRRGLPSIHLMYRLDDFVKIQITKPVLIDQHARSQISYSFRRPFNPFGPNPVGRFAEMSPC
jgi:hypothetical protein